MSDKVFEVGDYVWVLPDGKWWSKKSHTWYLPKKCKVVSHEIWHEGAAPTYYNLSQPKSNRGVYTNCTINWHFSDVYATEEECLIETIRFTENNVKFLEHGWDDREFGLRKRKDVNECKHNKSVAAICKRRLEKLRNQNERPPNKNLRHLSANQSKV